MLLSENNCSIKADQCHTYMNNAVQKFYTQTHDYAVSF